MNSDIKRETVGIHCLLAMLYFIALPLTISITSSGASLLKIFTLPIGVFFLVTMVFYKDKLELNSVHAFFALYIISVLSTLLVDTGHEAVSYVIGYIQNAALMFCVTIRKYNKKEIELLEYTQIGLLIILVVLSLFGGSKFSNRTSLGLFGSISDPNYFSGFFLFPMAVCMKKIKESTLKVPYVVLLVLAAYVVMLSGSRGGLLAMAVTIAAYGIISSKNLGRMILTMGIIVIAAMIFWTVVIPILPENISERFNLQLVIETRGTYRGDIWLSMLNEIKNSTWELFTGRGINAQHEMMIAGEMTEIVAHNHFIQTLYNQGIIGMILFTCLSVSSIVRNFKHRKHIVAGMLGVLTLAMTLSLNPSIKWYWNLVMYAALAFPVSIANAESEGEGDSNGDKLLEC